MEEDKNIYKIVGKNIKNTRITRGLTIDEVSRKTGISKQYLLKIEAGTAYRFTTQKLFLIASALETKAYILTQEV